MFAIRCVAARLSAVRSVALVAALTLGVLVAGCGATSGGSSGTLARPCSGPDGSVSDVGKVDLVLTTTSPRATGTPGAGGFSPIEGNAHVGDVIQIQLPTTNQWNLSMVTGTLRLLSPAAVLDKHASACFWNFTATTTGDTRLDFVGGALCEIGQACPAYARLESFLVHVM